ncbi:MAG: VOC family protein [Lysobacterales bacterium]
MKYLPLTRLLLSLVLSTPMSAAAAESREPSAPAAIIGIDHIPVAVTDLDSAATRYRQLGFSLKPGRHHDNGLRNSHVKFPDGSGMELISPPLEAADDLAQHYVNHLRQGEGPAYLSFHARDWSALQSALRSADIGFRDEGLLTLDDPALGFLFFVHDNRSASDKPEHFSHDNGAVAMTGVWLALDDSARDRVRRLLMALGAASTTETVFAAEAIEAEVFLVRNGRIVVLPQSHQLQLGRPVIRAEFRVRDLSLIAQGSGSMARELRDAKGGRNYVVPPQDAHGIWLEFHQAP